MQATALLAERFPDVKFENASGYARRENLANYQPRYYESRYVIGLVAGHMTRPNLIGIIGALPVPEVISGINAAFLGARSVNPEVKFRVVFANTWYDLELETDAARVLIEEGADVLIQHTDSTAPMAEAEATGIYAIANETDMAAPGSHPTATVNPSPGASLLVVRARKVPSWA